MRTRVSFVVISVVLLTFALMPGLQREGQCKTPMPVSWQTMSQAPLWRSVAPTAPSGWLG